jgi:tRNA(Met) cytidine acetyltransferase
MVPEQFSKWIETVCLNAFNLSHRRIVVLEGTTCWIDTLLAALPSYPRVSNQPDSSGWYLYSDVPHLNGNVNKHTFKNKLGTEANYILFHADSLNIDALAALSGTLLSGGILFLVFPKNTSTSPTFNNSLFEQRLLSKLLADPTVLIVKESDSLLPFIDNISVESKKRDSSFLEKGCVTNEQLDAVQHIVQVVKGHRNRPLVLTADRGRGKSSALAIACANLIVNSNAHLDIAITSAHRQSLDVFFKQVIASLGDENIIENKLNSVEHANGIVRFVAIDELLLSTPKVGLLLIDEAASIPLYQLNSLMGNYHRTVYSSTVHGYEGAGRSFALKFKKTLTQTYPNHKSLHIKQPIRWADNDPLESFIFDLCLLNAENVIDPVDIENIESCGVSFEKLSARSLVECEDKLSQIFSILVTAHYQTSPNDLRLLLDNEKLDIIVMLVNQHIVGVALLILEGNITSSDVALVRNNSRRLKNQFIPQSLLTHCGEDHSFDYSYYRIMRIAVLPELQDKGLGRRFLNYIETVALNRQVDFVGTSFGANDLLLNFWLQNQYTLARLGFTKDKASGEHSSLLLKPLNNKAIEIHSDLESRFYLNFEYLLAEQFKDISPKLIWLILHYRPQASLPSLTEFDHKTIEDFYTGKRQYNNCALSLNKWLHHEMLCTYKPEIEQVIAKVFQRKTIDELCKIYKFTGTKALNQYLISFVKDQTLHQ